MLKNLPRFNSERTRVLVQQEVSLERKICFAVSDYREALHRPEFAEHWGGAEALREDLFQLIELWHQSLCPQSP